MKYLFVAFVALWINVTETFAQGSYQVRSGDTLAIEVLEDQTLNRSVLVTPDGSFSFPFAGSIAASGRTVEQIRNSIVSGLRSSFATEPTVFVSVSALRPPPAPVARTPVAPPVINVYFVGEVNTPGQRPVAPGTTFLQALSQAGGFTNFAATKRVQLRRTNAAGQEVVTVIDYRALSQGARLSQPIILSEGDVILVPERGLFE